MHLARVPKVLREVPAYEKGLHSNVAVKGNRVVDSLG